MSRNAPIAAVLLALSACAPSSELTDFEWDRLSSFQLDELPESPDVRDVDSALSVALGERLFFDCLLSGPLEYDGPLGEIGETGRVSCASCHDPAQGGDDPNEALRTSFGVGKQLGRNTPTLYNTAWREHWGWTGAHQTLSDQIAVPLRGAPQRISEEMMFDHINDRYLDSYSEVFGDPVSVAQVDEDVRYALDAYLRTWIIDDSVFDRMLRTGDAGWLTPAATRGAKLFVGKAACDECHSGPTLSDHQFHNLGIDSTDPGRADLADVVGLSPPVDAQRDLGKFHTPPLRQVSRTAPYMHDGSMQTLWDVVDYYNFGGHGHALVGERDVKVQPLNLSDEEVNDLVAFLVSLEGPELPPSPWEDACSSR